MKIFTIAMAILFTSFICSCASIMQKETKEPKQIKETNYMQILDGYTGQKLAVGITYNKKDKKHFVKVEEM